MDKKLQKKQKKQKAKQRETNKKKIENQLFKIRRARYEREIAAEAKANSDKIKPIRNKTHLEKIQEHLENNLNMLKALEEEYIAAQQSKENLQEELEAEGYSTLEEKIEALRNKAKDLATKVEEDTARNKQECDQFIDSCLEKEVPSEKNKSRKVALNKALKKKFK